MQYTKDNTTGCSAEDLENLNRIYEHRIGLLTHEAHQDPDYRQQVSEGVLVDYAVLYYNRTSSFGQIDPRLQVIDPISGVRHTGDLVDLKATGSGVVIYLIDIPEIGPIPVLRYPDGDQFTPQDWSGGFDDIPDPAGIKWVYQDGQEAIEVGGLPRVQARVERESDNLLISNFDNRTVVDENGNFISVVHIQERYRYVGIAEGYSETVIAQGNRERVRAAIAKALDYAREHQLRVQVNNPHVCDDIEAGLLDVSGLHVVDGTQNTIVDERLE